MCCRYADVRRRALRNIYKTCPSGMPDRCSWGFRRTPRIRRVKSCGRCRWPNSIHRGLMRSFNGSWERSNRFRRWFRRCGWEGAALMNGRGKEKRCRESLGASGFTSSAAPEWNGKGTGCGSILRFSVPREPMYARSVSISANRWDTPPTCLAWCAFRADPFSCRMR